MARTFIRQDTQIRRSDVYDDTVVPSQANYETNTVHIEDDLNSVRSQLHNLLNVQTTNWYDDLVTPGTFESGAKRGVNDLNQDLHDYERKRVLRAVQLLVDVTVPSAVAATETLTFTGNASNGQTVSIDKLDGTAKVYTFETVLTNVDGHVLIGATASDSLDNLIAAINLAAGAGTLYAAATVLHDAVSAAAGAGDTMDITAKYAGTAANALDLSTTVTGASWGGATLSGGAGDIVILAAGELPSQTTAAVGAVTTLGTVVAYNASFGTATLDEVAGSSAVNPKNICEIVDGDTRDPILANGKKIWALLQSETVTDGHTITDTTPTRVQLTFVVINNEGNDLEVVDGTYIGGKQINYAYTERVAMITLNEQDFLRGAAIDVGAGAVTPTRQNAYNNQGAVPVDVTTNSLLDLEGAGLYWTIRDDLEADLFKITEGSAGSNSTVQIAGDVDYFDVNAVDNDFLNGIKVDTGAAGTTINVGVTANQIDSGGELTVASGGGTDLNLVAALELNLTDSYRAGSTWSLADGIALANSSAEWSAFETEFGEVSLLNAIVQASNVGGITKACANVTSTTVADTDVSLGDGNLDASLGDLSGGDFVGDHDVFLNGQLLRSGANSGANYDVYPGTSLANGQLRFEFVVKIGDVICVISRA